MTPAEKKASELAEQYESTISFQEMMEIPSTTNIKSFKAGFRAALALDEVKGLEEALEFECGNRCAEQNPCNAKEALTAWRSFRGEK